MNDITQRFIDVYEYLLNNKLVDSSRDFANKIDISASMMTEIIKKRSNAGINPIQKTVQNFSNIDSTWLLTGIGEMVKTKSKENATLLNGGENGGENGANPKVKDLPPFQEEAAKKNGNLIPLYDGLVAAGTALHADLSPQMEPVEYVDAGDWFRDATAAMRVHGDSMHPEYHSGSIIAMKRVNNKRLIVFGQDYVIETSEYRVLKRLQRSDEKEYWTLASVNTEIWEVGPLKGKLIHEPFDVHVDDVSRLFKVLGCVKRNESSRIVHNQSLK
ncbi:helix-turn-helix transcriptional regulator [Amniculibacterium sp. G2-70]|uniref:S24 family peptidase n=1 Tax=Amniculibacterium sp. G2-70 TaxID=2767188 RepID=UPI001653F703|nr:S24 family peptidase [Amniculibacterium sp. G2-70]